MKTRARISLRRYCPARLQFLVRHKETSKTKAVGQIRLFVPLDGSADTLDADLDGHNAWQEWKTWTDPTNALSVLKLLPPQPDTNGLVVSWQSALGQSYAVERATNANGPFSLLQGNIPGQTGTTSVTDTNPANGSSILYRVAVPE